MSVESVGLILLGAWLVLLVVVLLHPSRLLWTHQIKESFRKARLGDCVDPEVSRAVDQAFNHQRPPF